MPHSRASVMVGAGFSLNALPSPGVDTRFPKWHELARAMFDEIYPPSDKPNADREEQFNRSNPLRIASEYEAAFKRQKLKSFLRRRIPDSGHRPGPIHELLLQLPWRDMFTTNYDTLLERTEVPGRSYQPVTTVGDLTTAIAPRIIKLHGTLPSQTPFIITEEDYRTYPRRFAPLVNTVRQSLIEYSFVLVGFSGDDPNFLEWIGWIRDELAEHHAPIYLVGVLPDHVQRSLLVKRGVTPIDLSSVCGDHPRPLEHAIEWFLKNLLIGRPPSIYKWPKRNTLTKETKEYNPPLLIDGLDEPEEVSLRPPTRKLDEVTAWKILKRWTFERTKYPGWLVPTDEVRSSLWTNTEWWISPLLQFSRNRSPVDRVVIFYEINWRLDVSMVPLFEDTRDSFEVSIDELFGDLCDGGSIDPPSPELHSVCTGVSIEEAWLEIAFALLRKAREMYDAQRWDRFKKKIDRIVRRFPKYTDRCHYEHALWMMWNIRRSEAKEVLGKWSPSSYTALASMQKAALLAEFDALDEAQSLLRSALRHIRLATHAHSGQNIYLLSLEGWCMYLLHAIVSRTDFTEWLSLYDEFSDRWHELKTWNCSPLPLLNYFQTVLAEGPPRKKQAENIVFDFDPGRRTVTRSLGSSAVQPWLPAFSCIRLYEQVGIPAFYFGVALTNACKWIIPFTSFWSPALLVRAGKADEMKKRSFLDRPRVATMNRDLARNIHEWAMDALKREQVQLADSIPPMSLLGRLIESLVEVLSRLAVRLDSEELREAFSVAMHLHAEPGTYTHITLHESCHLWFVRLFAGASDSTLHAWLPELIRSPLPDAQKTSRNRFRWRDPINAFPTERLRSDVLQPTETAEIEEGIEWLLDRTRSESGVGWRRAVGRLITVYHAGLMTEKQTNTMATLLWRKTVVDGFPDLPDLLRFSYGHLPVPAHINVIAKIRSYLLGGTPQRSVTVKQDGGITVRAIPPDPLILEMAYVSKPIVHVPSEPMGFIEWSRDETRILWSKISEWWHNDKHALKPSSIFGSDSIIETVRNAGLFLRQALLPKMETATDDEWKEIVAFLEESRGHAVFLTAAWPFVLIHNPEYARKVDQIIDDDLSSDVEDAVEAGAHALRHWIHLGGAGLVGQPSKRLQDALLHRVVFRRPAGVASCLQQIALLLDEHPGFFAPDDVDLVVSSLSAWVESVSLPIRGDRDGEFREEQRPELRELVGKLAGALSVWLRRKFPDRSEPSAISLLRGRFGCDPLPEVRRSFEVRG